jgi:hypothetical protein
MVVPLRLMELVPKHSITPEKSLVTQPFVVRAQLESFSELSFL